MVVFLFLFNFIFLYFSIRNLLSRPLSYLSFYNFCFDLIIGLGIVLVYFYDLFFGYKMSLDNLKYVQYIFLICCCIRLIFNKIYRTLDVVDYRNSYNWSRHELSNIIVPVRVMAFISFVAMTIYVSLNGLGGFGNGYESRYEGASGAGILLIFFPAFLPLYLLKLFTANSKREILTAFMVFFTISLLPFYILNGYRQITIALLVITVLYLFHRKILVNSVALFIFKMMLGIGLLLLMSFIRYSSDDGSGFESALEASFYFIQGDIFPVDAVMKVDYYLEHYDSPGIEVVYNHLAKLIPRFFWDDKPKILLNSAGYYTVVILEYYRNLTLSPTILSNGLLVNGYSGVFLVYLTSLILMSFLDKLVVSTKSPITFIIGLSFIYMGFFVVREGIEAGLYRCIIMAIFIVSVKFFELLFVKRSKIKV